MAELFIIKQCAGSQDECSRLGLRQTASFDILSNLMLENSMPERPAPKALGGCRVICYTPIDDRHRFTCKTKQIVQGKLMGAMSGLAICQSSEAQEFYLFGCDADWNVVTDTWHKSLAEAKEQAEFEYAGVNQTWTHFA
jgi:hypothetical protein